MVTGGEVQEVGQLLQSYIRCFSFNLKDLGQLKGQETQIVLKDDNIMSKEPYRFNELERALVQVQTTKLLDVGLVE